MSKMLTSSLKASALLWMHRDILRQILSYVDGTRCDGRLYPALASLLTGMEM